jgi:hypothetical protein
MVFQMRLHEFNLIRTTADVDRIFKECQNEANRILQKYLEDRKTTPSIPHPSSVVEKEIDRLLNDPVR